MIKMSGSLPQQSSREKPRSLRPEVQDKHPVLDAHVLTDERVVENTFINETSVNEDAYRERMNLVAGFPEGRVITVTYFSQNNPITDIQSHVVDLNLTTKDDTHLSFTEIRNFEMRCSSELNFEYDSETNTTKVTGEALVFPRFTPRVADIFLYEMRQGQIGVFRIASVDRLALGQDTYHKVTFTMQNYLTGEYRTMLKRQATVTMYFDKKKYIAGNTALLTSVGFSQKKTLEHIRLEIIEDYIERFYSEEFSTFMRPDGLYDPYVVEYWNKKVSLLDSNTQLRPTQILISVANYRKSIWAVLTDNPIKNLANVEKSWNTCTYRSTFWGVNVTSLLGHKFITIGEELDSNGSYAKEYDTSPVLRDNTPFYHYEQDPQMVADNIEMDFAGMRYKMYGHHNTFQKCPPHAHGENTKESQDICYPDDCKHCSFDKCDNSKFPEAPYPIMSNDQLRDMYISIKHFDISQPLTEQREAQIRGYINWYRTTFEGTLSKSELKVLWAEDYGISPDKELTDVETEAFEKYVKSYRSKYLAVYTDRQIEFVYRMNHQLDNTSALTKEQLADLVLYIVDYRRKHGYPDSNSISELGCPVDAREAGAVMYDQPIMLTPPSATDLINLEYGIDEATNTVVVDIVTQPPEVFIPRKHLPSPVHCHTSICHFICGKEAKKKEIAEKQQQEQDEKSHYGLSSAFYEGSIAMDPFEKIVYDYLTNAEVDPGDALNAVAMYKSWSDEDAFYRHLLSLYIIDKALYWLMYH